MSTQNRGGEIQTRDFHFMRHDFQSIELLLGDAKNMFLKRVVVNVLSWGAFDKKNGRLEKI
jgi:hypothetical protein